MCTLTVIPDREGDGFRLVTNRDEQRDRARATPPELFRLDGVAACWPVDPVGGGTWIAVAEAGLALGLLNVNEDPADNAALPDDFTSRGRVIPALMSVDSSRDAVQALKRRRLLPLRPFRLVAADRTGVWSAHWNGSQLDVQALGRRPLCFASSGLGDHLVAPRLTLFDEWVAAGRLDAEGQDAFHRHTWPDRPEISVDMRRADARTVSRTVVEVYGDRSRRPVMTYDAMDEAPVRIVVASQDSSPQRMKGHVPTRC